MKKHSRKLAVLAAIAVGVGGLGIAFAYYTTTGAGDGTGSAGSASALVLHQTAPVNADYSAGDTPGHLYPGTTQTVHFTVDNNSPGHQHLGTISLASVTSDKAGCNSTAQPTWFSMPGVVVNGDYGSGLGQTVTQTGTITFNNDAAVSQDACQGAALAFHYTSN